MSCTIHARDVRYRYPGGREALSGIDLRAAHGERIALLGANGAGKTTFILHLNGLLRGTGDLEVAGLAVEDRNLRELRARVGVVFQDPDDQLFMPTVREDVAFGPRNMGIGPGEVARRTLEALETVRMGFAADRAPHQLSMGERRRVAIATVLVMNPRLLVLDEPSASLDPRARRELVSVLAALDRTLVVATHDLPLAAQLCERVVIMSAGRVAADGPCRDLLADQELLAAHDLEWPPGFDLDAVPEPRPAGARLAFSE